MNCLVLRLAAPLQSWSGYRHLAKLDSVVASEALPRKSAIAGLLGAALGPFDHGHGSARDLSGLGSRFTLHVRVDARNAPSEDFQVVGPLPEVATQRAERALALATASTQRFPSKRGGGNFATEVSRREFLPHSEFVVGIRAEEDEVRAWERALRRPTFMTYLGRRSCAPTFPFVLGVYGSGVERLFANLPWVDKYASGEPLLGYRVNGDYNQHLPLPHPEPYHPPAATREDQLVWVKENLQ